jgi:hypothetical protein
MRKESASGGLLPHITSIPLLNVSDDPHDEFIEEV